MSTNRLFEILYLLLEKKHLTAKELAARFEVSVRTIYRDIDVLSTAGIPIYATQGKGGGVALMEHYMLDRTTFTEAEQRQLLTALQSLPESARMGAETTLTKLSGLFHRQEAEWLQVDLSRWGCASEDHSKFDTLKNAILSQRIIQFQYVSSYGQSTDRRAYPARLVFKGQGWYLQAFCPEKEAYRTFKVSRILCLAALDEVFDTEMQPPSIEENSHLPNSVCIPIVVHFAPFLAYRVYDEFDEHCVTREADDSLLVNVAFPDDNWLYGYLLSFGTGVTVVSPLQVRKRLSEFAQKIWEKNRELDIGCQVLECKIGSSKNKEVLSMESKHQVFCQSCGMPLTDASQHATEADGSKSEHYCNYCYEKGAFTAPITMEEMIQFCAPMMAQGIPGMTEEQAVEQMRKFFPSLLRWKQS